MINLYPARLVRHTLGRKRIQLAEKSTQMFRDEFDPRDIESRQVVRFNENWEMASRLPFYAEWKKYHRLPNSISSIKELQSWPILTKAVLRQNLDLVEQTPGIVGSYRTSGSTGEPFAFPKGEGDFEGNYSTMWSYRTANGIRPFDPYLAVSTTLAGAAESWWAQRRNSLTKSMKHFAGNSWRTDGFIATSGSADKALRNLERMGAKYIVGYPSGIASLATRVEELGLRFPRLTHAILTSETIEPADIELISRAFQVTALVEYGAIELGAVAGSANRTGGWPLKVHWWSYLIHLAENGSGLISTLEPRGFPLINYEIGDIIEPREVTGDGSVITIQQVLGRTRDMVTVKTRNGELKSVLARSLHNLVRDLPGVSSVQVVQRQEGLVELLVVAKGTDRSELVRKMASSVNRNRKDYGPDSVCVSFIDQYITSARGKRGVVVESQMAREVGDTYSLITK